MSVPSYGSLRPIGHREIREIFLPVDGNNADVVVQEKVDGSQISFQIRDGAIEVRSKGAQLNIVAPDKMFAAGVAAIQAVADLLNPAFVYRGEYLNRPKHNTLAYDHTPANHIALFDVEDTSQGLQCFLSPAELAAEAARLGFDVVPTLQVGPIGSSEELRAMLDRVSMLGGAKVEGVVVKNYGRFTADGKPMMGKFVSEAFKETHAGEWRKNNPTQGDVLQALIGMYRTPARWAKAVQHLREAGRLTETPKDIGLLIKEVGEDVQRECEADIRDVLFEHFWGNIRRGVVGGVAEWYKEQLMASSFNDAADVIEGDK